MYTKNNLCDHSRMLTNEFTNVDQQNDFDQLLMDNPSSSVIYLEFF